MNLEGSLGAFGLADVFALLASTGKSGRLVLRRDGADRLVEGEVWFRDGRLSGASADLSRAALLRRVVGTGQVEDVALRQAVARATAGGRGAARALLESAAIDAEVLRTAAAEQALDAVADLLAWDDGEFSFELGTPDPDDIGLGLDPAQTAAAASTRAAEFADLTALVPGPDTVLVVRVAPDEDPVLTRDEWSLLALVDGRREVRDLVELTGSSHYAVVSTLAGLVRRGLLSLAEAGDHVAEVERRLALLAPLESATSAPSLTTADEPAPAPAPTPAPPEAAEPAEPPRTTVPEPPGAHGLTAAAALAAARAAQARPDTAARPAARREVVPPRPEPFLPGRRPDHPEPVGAPTAMVSAPRAAGDAVVGATARSLSEPAVAGDTAPEGVIERDPSVNRSLLLRLIAGVRGL